MSRKTSLYTGTMIGNPAITDGPLRDAALKALADSARAREKAALARESDDVIYVLVAERDINKPDASGRPIVFEQYIDRGEASLESVKAYQEKLGDKYGKTRIARLLFIDETAPCPKEK